MAPPMRGDLTVTDDGRAIFGCEDGLALGRDDEGIR